MMTQKIRLKALDLLARREHSAFELLNKLITKGFDKEQIKQVISNLSKENLQSDSRFAENYSHSRIAKGFGQKRIAVELRNKGIDGELIEQYLHSHPWQLLAQKQLSKKFGTCAATDLKTLARMKRFLEYRGFSSEWLR